MKMTFPGGLATTPDPLAAFRLMHPPGPGGGAGTRLAGPGRGAGPGGYFVGKQGGRGEGA